VLARRDPSRALRDRLAHGRRAAGGARVARRRRRTHAHRAVARRPTQARILLDARARAAFGIGLTARDRTGASAGRARRAARDDARQLLLLSIARATLRAQRTYAPWLGAPSQSHAASIAARAAATSAASTPVGSHAPHADAACEPRMKTATTARSRRRMASSLRPPSSSAARALSTRENRFAGDARGRGSRTRSTAHKRARRVPERPQRSARSIPTGQWS